MPPKRTHNIETTHMFSDGTSLSGQSFTRESKLCGGFAIDCILNKQWYQHTMRSIVALSRTDTSQRKSRDQPKD